ncbi:MAG: type II toxin-antitoxin system RatA family toxin [Rickettsiaceae bacterium]|nr:type II toxin-antitoxin system RatA family toxin [Rickettsiaceae bacterium]MDP4832916.1 type II toxin-antitoxin system RatA family toxin [Rickettsiaceae bacterium]MDP5021190.1 type II toxin-antitoxin system RatA family toxin [Rickettsiaceae bacterium]MDP5083749.1 type II toxin-antitoxin system RatA family toxin [Rickettsiaceae bacterium]
MHSLNETRVMPYDAALIHQIIMDIENYPDFLPWCSSAMILSQNEEYISAKLTIAFKSFSESYVSKVSSRKMEDGYEVETVAISGPFKHLKNVWKVKSLNNHSEVKFFIDFEFKSRILDMVMGVFFSTVTEKMIAAFETRAKELSID